MIAMIRRLTIFISCALAGLFAGLVPLASLLHAAPSINVALSIMIAAVFVRLNRGMPTLEWKSLELVKRSHLTAQFVSLTKEYIAILVINASLLAYLIILLSIENGNTLGKFPPLVNMTASGISGLMLGLALSRMGYVLWRDLDIVRLQKELIDNSAAREIGELETKSVNERIYSIKSAGLTKIRNPTPRPWHE